jgi:glutathionylspermidine synthase
MRRAIFDCCKWHVQADDRPVVCPFPMVMEAAAWCDVAGQAVALAREALAAEVELLRRPDLHARLGLPEPLRRLLRSGKTPTPGAARVMRIDFHFTADGWAVSEANTDAAGGFIESSGLTRLFAEHYPDCEPAGDPAGALAEAARAAVGPGASVALMHLTIYSEDRQVMLYLARRLEEAGLSPCLCSPDQVRWAEGRAVVECDWHSGLTSLIVRFFPAEWLPRLPARTGWEHFLVGGRTPVCNPASAVLTQSKRFSLTWDELETPLPTWRRLLPACRSPGEARGELERGGWVLKPALGHEGRDVAIFGVSDPADWRRVRSAALADERAWAAQRRFDVLPVGTPEGPLYPCLGVYVIGGEAAGAYGRAADRPLIDDRSRDVVVLVRKEADS